MRLQRIQREQVVSARRRIKSAHHDDLRLPVHRLRLRAVPEACPARS